MSAGLMSDRMVMPLTSLEVTAERRDTGDT
jgi:hypothetical protein